MPAVRGVMWLRRDAHSFRRHVAHHAAMAKANQGNRTRDPRNAICLRVERWVREALAAQWPLSPRHVLRWEARDLRQRWIEKFREHDGVFDCPDGTRVVLEVKSSASRSTIEHGLAQLREMLAVTAGLAPRTVGLLAVADLGALSDLFGQAAADPLANYFAEKAPLLDWPPRCLPPGAPRCLVTLVPAAMVQACLAEPAEVLS